MRTNEHNRFSVKSRLVSADLLAIAVVTNKKIVWFMLATTIFVKLS